MIALKATQWGKTQKKTQNSITWGCQQNYELQHNTSVKSTSIK